MKVTTVSATVRYSKPLPDGAWKAVELSAEATIEPNETWIEAQTSLYTELGQQLRTLWTAKANGNGQSNNGSTKAKASTVGQSEHYCHEHQTDFKRYEKEGRVWYAHKAGSKWCKEKS